ncbi:hypothetical protein [Acidisphaera sp. L21]|uniref:hypothetical protein n=1 Tax=Acidisphaera sp. L21 TaxID=1641851 RepID=UPI00131B1113|nr:hypothetical protein [Acidisphaera sp. L21]
MPFNNFVDAGVTSSGLTVSASEILTVSSNGTIITTTVTRAGNIPFNAVATAFDSVLVGGGSATIPGTDYRTKVLGQPPLAPSLPQWTSLETAAPPLPTLSLAAAW